MGGSKGSEGLKKGISLEDYTPEKVAVRIEEYRQHIRDELRPGTRGHPDESLVVAFIDYLDNQAKRFAETLIEPMDLLALTCRNLLELRYLVVEVFSTLESRNLFIGEMYLDSEEIRMRAQRMGIPEHMLNTEPPDWDTIPDKRFTIKRDVYDDYMFKLSSKCIHPTAVSILAPPAMPGTFIFYLFGLNCLGRSYNFLSTQVFPNEESWKAFVAQQP